MSLFTVHFIKNHSEKISKKIFQHFHATPVKEMCPSFRLIAKLSNDGLLKTNLVDCEPTNTLFTGFPEAKRSNLSQLQEVLYFTIQRIHCKYSFTKGNHG